MPIFDPKKLHIHFVNNINNQKSLFPRAYTLTHSDLTGDLFLTIGLKYDRKKISNLYTRLMRDEVLGEWVKNKQIHLNIHCHINGGIVIGTGKMRDSIFKYYMPLVLNAICYGDRAFLTENLKLKKAPIYVYFHARQKSIDRIEIYGKIQDYLMITK
jgi:hypothetical protein